MHVYSETRGVRAPGRFEIYWKRWSLSFEFIYSGGDEDKWPWMLHFHFLLLSAFIHLPIYYVPKSKREPYMRGWQQWGFSFSDDALHLYWNEHSKVLWLPWTHKEFQRHEVRKADGAWVKAVDSWDREATPDGREYFDFPYTYALKDGTIQNRRAKVHVERRAWRPKWFTWTPLFEMSRQCIAVDFNDEVGERSGSWKGGTVGCGYDMLPSETAEETLRRMEKERTFR